MNLAVRLYSDVSSDLKPVGIPNTWPYQVKELGSGTDLPSDGNTWQLMTKTNYDIYISNYQSAYDTWSHTYYATPLIDIVKNKIKAAQTFSIDMMAEYGAENVLSGKTVDQVIQISLDLVEIQPLLMSGSLYASLKKMSSFTPTSLVSAAIVLKYGNKIRTYLNLATVSNQSDLGNGF